MKSLVIDTCTRNVVIGLLNDNKIIDQNITINDQDLSSKFTCMVEQLLTKNNIKPQDIDTIFVAVGPGSFTGIRIGVTFAKVMAWTLNKKIIPFSSLELMATTNTSSDIIVPLIDARREYVYGGIYDNNLNVILEDKHILLSDILEIANSYDNVSYISMDKFNIEAIIPEVNIQKIVEKHFNDVGVNPHQLNPNYLKKTEAEEKLSGE